MASTSEEAIFRQARSPAAREAQAGLVAMVAALVAALVAGGAFGPLPGRWRVAVLLAAAGAAGAVLAVLWRLATRSVRPATRDEASDGRADALQAALDHMGQGLVVVDAAGTVIVHNRRVLELLDLPAGLLAARPHYADVIAFQRASGEFAAEKAAPEAAGTPGSGTLPPGPHSYERRRPDGRILEIQGIPLPGGGMVRTYADVTERRRSEEQVRYLAHHDSLTTLLNRAAFGQRLAEAMRLADGTGRGLAVLYLDLDRFKLVNDTRGHAAGDALLAQLGARLRGAVRDTDAVARMGGDEFAVLQPLVGQPDAAVRLAQRVLHVVGQSFVVDGVAGVVGVSIGIALYPAHAANAAALLHKADLALYRAKRGGGGIACLFDPGLDAAGGDHAAQRRTLTGG